MNWAGYTLSNRIDFDIVTNDNKKINYWINEQNTSVHFVIRENGEIYQSIPSNEVAYHAGENDVNKFVTDIKETLQGHPNSRTIGIEMENLGSVGYK